ncbi:hypothetical protein IV203_027330 [Nitzschia inconspicua]|uniref:Sulfotransferase n=1 Tax=Nitzschia inconspicua TaxID=303405 RepID=A0A9K3Q5Z3_9STRA|nr:hypothetical protein IV203_027330 [Nitzschia inconspicua]
MVPGHGIRSETASAVENGTTISGVFPVGGCGLRTFLVVALMIKFSFMNLNLPSPKTFIVTLADEVRNESLVNVQTASKDMSKQQGAIQRNGTNVIQNYNEPKERGSPSMVPSDNSDTNEIVFTHYLGHIPKSGTSYAFGALARILSTMPEYQPLKGLERFRGCNMAATQVRKWKKKFMYQYGGSRCTMWMTEPGLYTPDAMHSYVIIREPISHTVSMYFHCKESQDHKRLAYRMPSTFDEWVQAWHTALRNATKLRENKDFACYDPINFQSNAIAYDPSLGKEDLRKKWDIVGDSAQMDKTVCLILIKYTGWIPKECDCTDQRRRLENVLEYDPNQHAHGVQHHGATFQTTSQQEQLISEFRSVDQQLYDLVVNEIFPEQVREVEQQYNIAVCDKFRVTSDVSS